MERRRFTAADGTTSYYAVKHLKQQNVQLQVRRCGLTSVTVYLDTCARMHARCSSAGCQIWPDATAAHHATLCGGALCRANAPTQRIICCCKYDC